MATELPQNRYPGVNAHLNSFLQQRGGGWESFHARYIGEMQVFLDQVLPGNYYSIAEKSLQITQYGADETHSSSLYPDVSIFRQSISPTPSSAVFETTAPTMTLPLREVLLEDEEEDVNAVVIYNYERGQIPGKPVTRIELLSPANKPRGSDYNGYSIRRRAALKAGISLVEIDFLHKQRPILSGLPSYPDRQEGASPYLILVTDLHPDYENGLVDFYEFGVDAPLPKIRIPLQLEDQTVLDLGSVYNTVFETTRVFRMVVDYAADPVDFKTYTSEDQNKIRTLVKQIPG